MNREEIIEQQNAYYMAGYPSRRSENKMDKDKQWDNEHCQLTKAKEKDLKWTDLKLGDVIKPKDSTISYLIIGVDSEGTADSHILIGKTWVEDVNLCDFVKVEE